MIEKVNPAHPDKVADRIAGAIVDLAYSKQDNPKIAVEVLIGHGVCHIISETSVTFYEHEIQDIVERIAGKKVITDYVEVAQDKHLARNQSESIKCGDNGIFKGVPLTSEQTFLSRVARNIYREFKTDGKYIFDRYGKRLFVQRVGSFSSTGKSDVTGDEFKGWDGIYNGHPMPSDDYWYLITVEEIRKQYTGHFTLKR